MHRTFTLSLICFAYVTSFGQISLASENSPLNLEEIRAVWKQRSERIRRARFEVSIKQTRSKLSFMSSSDKEEEEAVKQDPVEVDKLAKDYVTFNLNYSLIFDVPRVFWRAKGFWPDENLRPKEYESIMVTDGVYASTQGSFQNHPTGTIHANSKWGGSHLLGLKPIQWAICPSDASLGIPLDDFRPKTEMQAIDDIPCTVIERDFSDKSEIPGSKKMILWIAPKLNDCVVLKYAAQVMGRTIVEYRCQYDFGQPIGAIPTSWFTIWFLKDGGTRTRTDAIVDSYEINPVVKDSDFHIDFPVGTFVTDMRKLDRHNHEQNYIVRKNGEKRYILWEERDKTYEELLASDTPLLNQQKNSTDHTRFLIIVINIILVLVVLSIALFKSYKTKP